MTNKSVQGIGGWMLVVVVGLIYSPIQSTMLLFEVHASIFSSGVWQAVTSPDSEAYHPLWAPLITLSIGSNILIAVFALVVLAFLFKKSRYTPVLVIAWLATTLLLVATDFVLTPWLIPAASEQPADPEATKELIRSLISAAIWIPYFIFSKRVKATFTREWPNNSFKPKPLRGSA